MEPAGALTASVTTTQGTKITYLVSSSFDKHFRLPPDDVEVLTEKQWVKTLGGRTSRPNETYLGREEAINKIAELLSSSMRLREDSIVEPTRDHYSQILSVLSHNDEQNFFFWRTDATGEEGVWTTKFAPVVSGVCPLARSPSPERSAGAPGESVPSPEPSQRASSKSFPPESSL